MTASCQCIVLRRPRFFCDAPFSGSEGWLKEQKGSRIYQEVLGVWQKGLHGHFPKDAGQPAAWCLLMVSIMQAADFTGLLRYESQVTSKCQRTERVFCVVQRKIYHCCAFGLR